MVRLTKIYTRSGDSGLTSLGNGGRVAKCEIRVDAYGIVDEVNAAIGVARLDTDDTVNSLLSRIQNDLFDVGADLCLPEGEEYKHKPLRVNGEQVQYLEQKIDEMNEELQPLSSFILPAGSSASAYLHLARTIARRAERRIVELANIEAINEHIVKYLNRLSDFLFVLARYLNAKGKSDVLWVPGENR